MICNWGVCYVTILSFTMVICCPVITHHETTNNRPRHLTSKRSLESSLRSALSPLEQLDPLVSAGHTVQRVPQDLHADGDREEWTPHHGSTTSGDAQGDKRFNNAMAPAYPYNDYLIWMRSGECPQRDESATEFFCPSPDPRTGQWSCVSDLQLCDQMRDCPNGEDELPVQCLFYHVIQSHITRLTHSLIWSAARDRGL